jgi:predicted metalloprotease
MRWKGRRRSANVDDRRGGRGARRAGFGMIGTVALVLVGLYLGVDPALILQSLEQAPDAAAPSEAYVETEAEAKLSEFISVVLADTEETWTELFAEAGGRYAEPTLVLYTGVVQSACGTAQSAVGPFYCPGDHQVYIDLSFFDELRRRFGAPGDFAQAYVLAHEVGHHVQTLLGISEQMRQAQRGVGRAEANELSVRLELQADCFAGIWGHHADRSRQLLEQGDIEEGLAAAAAIGDDRLQRQTRRQVSPETFTHGTSAQRQHWFKAGLSRGTLAECDTFAANAL